MNLFNFGREQLQNGMLNNMLSQAGIDDVGSFVQQFRQEAAVQSHQGDGGDDEDEDTSIRHASGQQANLFSMGSSMLNQFAGNRGQAGGSNPLDMIQGAMKAYETFSGDRSGSGSGGGNFFDNMSSTYQNAQKMYALYKQFDKNGDGKITVEDIEIYLKETGLGFVSPYLARALFQAVDQNHNGTLDFTDLMALVTILNKLQGEFGGVRQ
ncbi:unnamed protein product [Adineta ricciae]|uniref:EF-hand domain-containing protein n=1 Tax=Adineta ricciae TaxID=249248 RepID=A0A813RH48_ADIRI|nr:unnamed protein product [Adineta ricciae]